MFKPTPATILAKVMRGTDDNWFAVTWRSSRWQKWQRRRSQQCHSTMSKAATLAPNFQQTAYQWMVGLIGIRSRHDGELIDRSTVTGNGLLATYRWSDNAPNTRSVRGKTGNMVGWGRGKCNFTILSCPTNLTCGRIKAQTWSSSHIRWGFFLLNLQFGSRDLIYIVEHS